MYTLYNLKPVQTVKNNDVELRKDVISVNNKVTLIT